jgi:ABC-type multidrug transport system fused ATPase/permease subunit
LELKRIVSIQQSPLIAHISESLVGQATIHAFRLRDNFVKKQRLLTDDAMKPLYLLEFLKIWLQIRLAFLSASITFGIVLLAHFLRGANSQIAVSIGLALAFSSRLTISLNELVTWLGVGEAQMNAVERIDFYGTGLVPEAPRSFPTDPSEVAWPVRGEIEFKSVQVRYRARPDHAVITDLSLSIKSGEKIGVVGRTGSGKSTLMAALFRIVELHQGRIFIDGLDICKMGLKTLRSRIQMIPQEPILFSGTIRSNLDLENVFSDQELWDVLSWVGLKDYVSQLEEKLCAPVSPGGDNLSAGQRQILCLARAILLRPKILVMDEATASVDPETNTLIEKALTTHFPQTTVISIAHRLNTIAGFDRIVVLQDGRLAECEHPFVLLQNQQSLFSQLTNASGEANDGLIRAAAYESYQKSKLDK